MINVNNNNLQDITPIINKFSYIKEIHASCNNISTISCDIEEGKGKYVKIIDLSHNDVKEEGDIMALGQLKEAEIINLEGNALVCHQDWKNNWNGAIHLNLIY